MIDGKTRLVGLIGWPVEHSLSPRMHNAAFERLSLNWCYVPMPVASERLRDALRGLVCLGFAGVNVTIPHKQAVVACLDEATPEVRYIGAANTIVFQEGRAIGHNTDVYGFLAALREIGFSPQGRRAAVLGAGGAARAVVYALASSGSRVAVLNRSQQRAQALVEDLSAEFPSAALKALPLTVECLEQHAAAADLLVNTTSVGMWPEPDRCPWPEELALPSHLTVFDLVYSPPETELLKKAVSVGAKSVGGLGMLVHQGAAAFRLWTGREPPVEVMYKACRSV